MSARPRDCVREELTHHRSCASGKTATRSRGPNGHTSTVVSIGYERRSTVELIGLLLEHRVRKVVDVREAPVSRRKDFNKTLLSRHLANAGIRYQHLKDAGNPYRHHRDNIKLCLALYAEHLEGHPSIVTCVAKELFNGPVAVLCYERAHDLCHRGILLEAIKEAGMELLLVRAE